MTNEIVVTNTDTGTPGASDNTMPATADNSANTVLTMTGPGWDDGRIAEALDSLSPEERKGAELFLRQVVDGDQRDMVARLIGQ